MLPTWPAAKILWLARHEPRTFEQTARFLLIEDYFLWRLTGRVRERGLIAHLDLLLGLSHQEVVARDARRPGHRRVAAAGHRRARHRRRHAAAGSGPRARAAELDDGLHGGARPGLRRDRRGTVGPGRFSENTGAAVALCATLAEARLDPAAAHALPLPRRARHLHVPHLHERRRRAALVPRPVRRGRACPWRPRLGADAYDLLAQEAGDGRARRRGPRAHPPPAGRHGARVQRATRAALSSASACATGGPTSRERSSSRSPSSCAATSRCSKTSAWTSPRSAPSAAGRAASCGSRSRPTSPSVRCSRPASPTRRLSGRPSWPVSAWALRERPGGGREDGPDRPDLRPAPGEQRALRRDLRHLQPDLRGALPGVRLAGSGLGS